MSRCRSTIEAPIPDEPSITRSSIVMQCEKESGHAGACRNEEKITWPGPQVRINP